MNRPCATCRFHREVRPLTERLVRDLGAEEIQLVNELTKMMQEERQKADAEADQLTELLRKEADHHWPIHPEMTSYCGLRETDEEYFATQLKNPAAQCRDHRPGPRAVHACATCVHRVTGGGPERDRQHFAKLSELAANGAAVGLPAGISQLEEFKSFVATTKARESVQAFYGRKLTHQPPEYLPTCGKHSTSTEFIPCAVQNPHDVCPDWSPSNGTPAASPLDGWALLAGGRTP